MICTPQTRGKVFIPCANDVYSVAPQRQGKWMAVGIVIVTSSMTFLSLCISLWWRQTWEVSLYFTIVNQSEARISTEHGIKFCIRQNSISVTTVICQIKNYTLPSIIGHWNIFCKSIESLNTLLMWSQNKIMNAIHLKSQNKYTT